MVKMRTILTAVFASAISALVIPACSAGDSGLTSKNGRGNDNGDGGTGGSQDEDEDGGAGGRGGSWDDDPDGVSDGGGNECAADSQKAERMPLDMYIMLDKSGSMAFDSPTRWSYVTSALKSFIGDTASHGIGVGLQYFPLANECNANSYKTPAPGLGIQLLPTHAAALEKSLNDTKPNGGTPTRPALEGALQYAKEWADGHPGHTVIVVLATDGQPEGCSNNTVAAVSNVAADYANNHGIKTFVIGIGSSLTNLNAIAEAGGTDEAFIVSGANAGQQFIDAMNEIRGVSLACEYVIPAPKDANEKLDYEKVNMRFTKGDGTVKDLDYVGDASKCGSDGWYYDDPAAPTKILVCPETCEKFKADGEGQVDVLLGCKRRGPA